MNRWFRHYIGMMRDEKLVRVAVKANQPVERVIWVWGAILESAAEINDGGKYDFDTDEAAYFLRCEDNDIASIIDGLEISGRIVDGLVARWGNRQFDSDSSRRRQQEYRERKKNNNQPKQEKPLDNADNSDGDGEGRGGDGERPSRDGEVTPQEYRGRDRDYSPSLRSGERARARGTRLPEDFVLELSVATEKGLSEQQARREAEKFRNHFLAAPGQKGVKRDWGRTWANWVINAIERYGTGPPSNRPKPPAVIAMDLIRESNDDEKEPSSSTTLDLAPASRSDGPREILATGMATQR